MSMGITSSQGLDPVPTRDRSVSVFSCWSNHTRYRVRAVRDLVNQCCSMPLVMSTIGTESPRTLHRFRHTQKHPNAFPSNDYAMMNRRVIAMARCVNA